MRFIRLLILPALLLAPIGADAQSLLDRPPNMSGDWTGVPGTIFFNFLHRFSTSGAPKRKVSNVPTFLLAAGLPKRLLAGFNYSTNSTLAPGFPNEWELFARWAPLSQDYGAPLDLAGQIGYNNAASGVDGELSLARQLGIGRLILAGRTLSDPLEEGDRRYAVAGGAVIHLGTYVSLAGDIASLTSRDTSERVAWSAGFHFAIPLTPHTLSLQVTNALVATLQGQSRGTEDVRFGFEFTIPLTLRRYFGGRGETPPSSLPTEVAAAPADSTPPAVTTAAAAPAAAGTVTPAPAPRPLPATSPVSPAPPPPPPPAGSSRVQTPSVPADTPASRPPARVVRTSMKNITYLQPRLQVAVGTTIEWTNSDPLQHTVTAVDRSFDSGLIGPGKKFRHTFTKPGTYTFSCVPHPFMKGTVVVRAP